MVYSDVWKKYAIIIFRVMKLHSDTHWSDFSVIINKKVDDTHSFEMSVSTYNPQLWQNPEDDHLVNTWQESLKN